jgi:hypothetical protein
MAAEPSEEREIRAAWNQSMFRAINERLTREDPLGELAGSHVISCECADLSCVQTLAISAARYEQVRKEPRHFAVLPGHVLPDVERVVAEHETYVVVEKFGEAGEMAEVADEADPERLR